MSLHPLRLLPPRYQRVWFRDRERKRGRKPAVQKKHEKASGLAKSSAADDSETVGYVRAVSPVCVALVHLTRLCDCTRESYIFDGKTLNLEGTSASFQVCDITDPVPKLMLEDEAYFRDEFDVSSQYSSLAQQTSHVIPRLTYPLILHTFYRRETDGTRPKV
jgi:hypothetical protein